ncbi:secretory protein Sec24A [Guillardia theta CCMP2712]|uniref:Secretory protein Sec24A n=1 Tax=Guillardia theta (strain CCMP2712) TaxID=905079 RepID=L1I5Z2_GUITC|nr:secretory protein Sec24A [Guillardia theta CCMP2712]EKX31688.1 secretory protein Sec24A [Guillardia theta CCMP2712]|eukprot:XP_005818668.1 secretory protein Sec24A [Guillardia theta CCMP2712]
MYNPMTTGSSRQYPQPMPGPSPAQGTGHPPQQQQFPPQQQQQQQFPPQAGWVPWRTTRRVWSSTLGSSRVPSDAGGKSRPSFRRSMAPPPTGSMAPPPTGSMAPPPTGSMAPPPTGSMAPPPTGGMPPPMGEVWLLLLWEVWLLLWEVWLLLREVWLLLREGKHAPTYWRLSYRRLSWQQCCPSRASQTQKEARGTAKGTELSRTRVLRLLKEERGTLSQCPQEGCPVESHQEEQQARALPQHSHRCSSSTQRPSLRRKQGRPAGAPTEQMAGMSIGGRGPAQAFNLGEIPQCPQDGVRTAQSYIEDQVGQSNPRYMQCSVGAIPASQAVAQKFSLPMAVTIHPLNDPPVAPGYSAVPVSYAQVLKYINPFVTWLDAGRRWRCNVCGLLNDVPADYYCSLDSSGKRRDHAERPELNFGSVEYVAPADYMVRPPQPPTYVFCIDVSARSVQSGLLTEVANTILANLDKLPGGSRTQIGFVTFDSSFHFYCLKSSLQEPQMLCVADLDDPFLPLPSELLVNLVDSREQVESLLRKLPSMFSATVNPDSAFYPALQPTVRPREDTSLLGSEHEAKILNPANDSFSCDLMHEEQNLTCSHVCIQSALLYTTSDGERRIRVHNLNVPVTQNFVDLYSTIDVPTTMNSLLKSAVEQAQNTKLIDARSKIQSACVQSLRAHRLM